MATMGFLEEKPKREIQLFHEEIWQDCVHVQRVKESRQTCFPGASAGDKFSLAPSQERMNYPGCSRYILDTASICPSLEM